MLLKALLLLNAALLLSAQGELEFWCRKREDSCWIENVIETRKNPNYRVLYPGDPSEVFFTYVVNSRLSVVNRQFCQIFPQLAYLEATEQYVESLTPDAFSNCPNLQTLFLNFNNLTQVPENLVRGSEKLKAISLESNNLTVIPEKLFETNLGLRFLLVQNNYLKTLSPEIFRGLNILENLSIAHNDLTDIDVDAILDLTPRLGVVGIQDNLIPCSKIRDILGKFRARGVWVHEVTDFDFRPRSVPMDFVDGFRCVRDT